MPGPDCFKCRHLKITWRKDRPYACQAMGFMSREIPWRVVQRSSGMPCMVYSPKPGRQQKKSDPAQS